MRIFKFCFLLHFLLIPVLGQQISAFEEIDRSLMVEAEIFILRNSYRNWNNLTMGLPVKVLLNHPKYYSISHEFY